MPKGVIWAGASAGSNQPEGCHVQGKDQFVRRLSLAPGWNPTTNPITMSHRVIRWWCCIGSFSHCAYKPSTIDLTLERMSLEHQIFNAPSVLSALQQVVRGFPGHQSFVHEMSDDMSYLYLVVELSR